MITRRLIYRCWFADQVHHLLAQSRTWNELKEPPSKHAPGSENYSSCTHGPLPPLKSPFQTLPAAATATSAASAAAAAAAGAAAGAAGSAVLVAR